MKRKYILALVVACVAIGPGWGTVLHGKAQDSKASAEDVAGAHTAQIKSKPHPGPALVEPPPTRLKSVLIQAAEDGKGTTIDISTSRPVAYRVLHLENPDRLVLDLEGARNGTRRWEYASGSPLLSRVRVGRFSQEYGGTLRVVADLKGDPAYTVDRQATGFRIELTPRSSAIQDEVSGSAAAGDRLESPVADGPVVPHSNLAEATKGPTDQAEVEAEIHQAGTIALRRDPEPPVGPDGRAAAGDPSTPVVSPKRERKQALPKAVQAAKTVIIAQESAPSRAVVPVTSNGGEEANPKYTGKLISLNLKGVDLKDFFRLIHEVSGLNIMVDSDVSGTVTVVLDEVPWEQALDLVLSNNGLGDRLQGNVLRIAKISTLTREQQEDQKLRVADEDLAPLVTVFRPVNYAKAATLAALLKTWVGGGALSRRGSVLVDERTNTLIISDIGSQIPAIESVIGRLDQKAQQISIEARIIRATSDFARNLSTALSFAQRNGSGSLVTAGAVGNPVSGTPLVPPTVTSAAATGFGVFVLSNLGANYAINAAIAAAESRDQAKTISQPSIVTQNNVEGTVIQGTQIPIQTTINNTISVQYVQASLELKVTPQVTQDGHVFLTIAVTNASPGPALTFAGPTINTQSATTQILVPNGGTVVFGGVTVHTTSDSSTGVPWLEDIPLLGHLFKSTSVQRNDQELLFFVTPKLLAS
jgi:type IV pilus assembly protein PilQ